jgi:hypothetical protein
MWRGMWRGSLSGRFWARDPRSCGKKVWDVLEGLRELPKETPEQWVEWLIKIGEELLGGGKSDHDELEHRTLVDRLSGAVTRIVLLQSPTSGDA